MAETIVWIKNVGDSESPEQNEVKHLSMAPTFMSFCVSNDTGPLNRPSLRLKGDDERTRDSKSAARGKSSTLNVVFLPSKAPTRFRSCFHVFFWGRYVICTHERTFLSNFNGFHMPTVHSAKKFLFVLLVCVYKNYQCDCCSFFFCLSEGFKKKAFVCYIAQHSVTEHQSSSLEPSLVLLGSPLALVLRCCGD